MTEVDMRYCANCKNHIAAANFTLHDIHCTRNIVLCPQCEEPVPRMSLETHMAEQHAKVRCSDCHTELEFKTLDRHKQDFCIERLIVCEFCDSHVIQKNLKDHQSFCGARTEKCHLCQSFIMLKDLALHNQFGCDFNAPSIAVTKYNNLQSIAETNIRHNNLRSVEDNVTNPGNLRSVTASNSKAGNLKSDTAIEAQLSNMWSAAPSRYEAGNCQSVTASNSKAGNLKSDTAIEAQLSNMWSAAHSRYEDGNFQSVSASNFKAGNLRSVTANNLKAGNLKSDTAIDAKLSNMRPVAPNDYEAGNLRSAKANNLKAGNLKSDTAIDAKPINMRPVASSSCEAGNSQSVTASNFKPDNLPSVTTTDNIFRNFSKDKVGYLQSDVASGYNASNRHHWSPQNYNELDDENALCIQRLIEEEEQCTKDRFLALQLGEEQRFDENQIARSLSFSHDTFDLPCESCGGFFPPEMLLEHQSACSKNLPTYSFPPFELSKLNGDSSSSQLLRTNEQIVFPCEYCDQLFVEDILFQHQSHCLRNNSATPAPLVSSTTFPRIDNDFMQHRASGAIPKTSTASLKASGAIPKIVNTQGRSFVAVPNDVNASRMLHTSSRVGANGTSRQTLPTKKSKSNRKDINGTSGSVKHQ